MKNIITLLLILISLNSTAQVHLDQSKLLSYVNTSVGKRIYIMYIDVGDSSRVNWSVVRNDTTLTEGYTWCRYQFFNVPEVVWRESTVQAFNLIADKLNLTIVN